MGASLHRKSLEATQLTNSHKQTRCLDLFARTLYSRRRRSRTTGSCDKFTLLAALNQITGPARTGYFIWQTIIIIGTTIPKDILQSLSRTIEFLCIFYFRFCFILSHAQLKFSTAHPVDEHNLIHFHNLPIVGMWRGNKKSVLHMDKIKSRPLGARLFAPFNTEINRKRFYPHNLTLSLHCTIKYFAVDEVGGRGK